MKKIVLALFSMLFLSASIFAQSDLQVLTVVKYNKSESITVKQLKKRVGVYEKQLGRTLNVEEKKEVLNAIVGEKLICQAAQKEGFSIPDSTANQYFELQLSQIIGAPVTESQFEEIVKKQFNMSLEEFIMKQVGMTKSEFKDYLKTQLLMQQYIVNKYQAEITKVAPTDEQIRMFFEANKANFVWKDMAKMIVVGVPKGNDAKAAKNKIVDLKNKLANKKITDEKLLKEGNTEKSGYIVKEGLVEKSQIGVKQLGIPMEDLLDLFSKKEGYVTDINETDDGYTFVSIVKKFDAKMLGISDVVQPETTVTVYDYIRNGLTEQLRVNYVQKAMLDLAKNLNKPANVEMKKTGAALDKLLDWGD